MISKKKNVFSSTAFVISVAITLTISAFYLYNIFKWANYPDFGYGFRSATGIYVVGVLTKNGKNAGMQIGDQILEVNGSTFSNIEEFRARMHRELGEENTYLLDRQGRTFAITIKNIPSGLKRAFSQSGLPYFVGLCYTFIGILVFMMKPHQRPSWIFFLYGSTFGLLLTFLYQIGPTTPLWFQNFNIIAYCFTPAVYIHLALSFPEERKILQKHPYFQAVPYIISIVLFVLIRQDSAVMAYAPKHWLIVSMAYIAIGVLFFLGSCFQLRLTSKSHIVKLRSRIILLGFAIAASIPLIDYVFNALFSVYLLPNINYMLPFFIIFPASIGYAIVKHDLFDIDAIIKRTYGYVLTTGTLAGIYGIFVLISNLAFGSFEFAKTPVFTLIFLLAIVFLFNPIRNRVQKFIDRVFYRLEYNYQETVHQISESMRTLLGLNKIGQSIMDTALGTMFIDSGCVFLQRKNEDTYKCLTQMGAKHNKIEESEAEDTSSSVNPRQLKEIEQTDDLTEDGAVENTKEEFDLEFDAKNELLTSEIKLSAEEPLITKLSEYRKEVTAYDIQEDPFFEDQRDSCIKVFEKLNATLIVPLIYEERLTGLISLGQKKSGKFYRQEDVNLLKILANQGAVAIENACMVEEIIEKERIRIKIMDSFGKYVTPEVRDQILAGEIPLDGETKRVTVLFADLRDFTTLSESTTPKEVVRIINGYFSEMADAIGQNHGLVLQFIGDEIEAVFGAPLPLDDHPTHAVRAALAMQQRLLVVNEKLKEQGYKPLRHGIGIHTGKVVAANIGSKDRLSYAMVGDTVNLASRIQGLNKKFGTDLLISAKTVDDLAFNIAVEKLPATTVKGKRQLVEVYKLA